MDTKLILDDKLKQLKLTKRTFVLEGKNTEEIDNANYAIEFLGGKISDKKEFSLPNNVGERTLVKVEKVSDTPNGYPRVYDKIHKYPIAKNKKIK